MWSVGTDKTIYLNTNEKVKVMRIESGKLENLQVNKISKVKIKS